MDCVDHYSEMNKMSIKYDICLQYVVDWYKTLKYLIMLLKYSC